MHYADVYCFPTVDIYAIYMIHLSLDYQQNPNDIAYVHSGYAPLSVRLVQFLERQSDWRGMEELLKNIPGQTVEEKQEIPPALIKKGKLKI